MVLPHLIASLFSPFRFKTLTNPSEVLAAPFRPFLLFVKPALLLMPSQPPLSPLFPSHIVVGLNHSMFLQRASPPIITKLIMIKSTKFRPSIPPSIYLSVRSSIYRHHRRHRCRLRRCPYCPFTNLLIVCRFSVKIFPKSYLHTTIS